MTLRSATLPGRMRTPHHPLGMTFEYETLLVPDDQPPLGTEVLEYSIKTRFPYDLPNGSNVYRPIPKKATAMEGELFAGSRNAPRTMQQPGRVLCSLSVNGRTSSHVSALDFDAKKTGR